MRRATEFVGRAHELSVIRDAFDAGRHEPVVVLVTGEAGIGKSWLARKAVSELDPEAMVARGVATGRLGPAVPFEPWIPILERLLKVQGVSQDAACRALGVDPSHLRGLLPALPSDRGSGDPARLLPAITCLIRAAAADSQVVVVLDDLHWADDASLRVLASLIPQLHSERLTLLLIMRSSAEPPHSPLGSVLQRASRCPFVRRLCLSPFSHAEAKELLDSFGLEPARALRVAELAQGNPLMLAQLAHVRPGNLKPTAGALIAAALADLDAHAQGALRVVAARGVPTEESLVCAVLASLGLNGSRGVAAAVESDVIRRMPGDRGPQLAVRHDLLAEAAIAGLEIEERIAVNSALLDALDHAPDGREPASLARLAVAAGRTDEALTYSMQAGLAARSVHAFREADKLFDLAAEVWPGDRPVRRVGLSRNEFQVLRVANADDASLHDKALALIVQAESGLESTEAGFRARLQLRRAAVLQHTLRIQEAVAALTPALEDLPTLDDRREAAYLLALAHLHSGLELTAPGIRSTMDDATQHFDSVAELGIARVATAASATTYAETADALEVAAEAFVRVDLSRYLETATYLAHAQYLSGDEEASLSTLQRAMTEVEGVPPEFEWYGELYATLTAYLLSIRGEWTRAEVLLRQWPGSRHPRVRNYKTIVSDRLTVLTTGTRPTCWPSIGADQTDIGAYAAALEFTFWSGDVLRGASLADRAVGYVQPSDAYYLAWLRARAYAECHQPAPANLCASLTGQFDPAPSPADGAAMLMLASVEVARARNSDVSDAWLAAGAALDAARRPYPAAYARWRAASSLISSGRVTEASEPLRTAHHAAAALPLPALVDRLESLAARARVTLPTPEPAGDAHGPLAVLTARERDVLHLLAAGATNGEIAASLHVETSTVATHVSSILRKLHVASRYAAAALHDEHMSTRHSDTREQTCDVSGVQQGPAEPGLNPHLGDAALQT